MSLVPDYGSSSSDSCSDSDSGSADSGNEDEYQQKKKNPALAPLPSATALLSGRATASDGVVFNNPYKDAENAKIASLEKHVKMVATEEHTQVKNGKKICWNFRKGRCRFGSNCTFAHDSDLHKSVAMLQQEEVQKKNQALQIGIESSITKMSRARATPTTENEHSRKRPGLGDSIVPSKKVQKHYKRMAATAAARTSNTSN